MNPWDKSSRPEPVGGVPPVAKPPIVVPPPPEPTAGGDLPTNRLQAETVRLQAETNEALARQLRELQQIGAWLHRELAEKAEQLQQSDQAQQQEIEAVRAQATVVRQEAQRVADETARLQAQVWPAAFQGEAWRSWRERIGTRAAAEPLVAVLLARLHLAAALERTGRPLALELVREIGRSVYEASPEEADKIAQALAQSGGGRFEIRTVRVGDRIDNKFMKPSAPGLAEVRAVSSWAIRDNHGIWQFPAEVS